MVVNQEKTFKTTSQRLAQEVPLSPMPTHPGHVPPPKWLNLHLPAIPGNVRSEVGTYAASQPGKSGENISWLLPIDIVNQLSISREESRPMMADLK